MLAGAPATSVAPACILVGIPPDPEVTCVLRRASLSVLVPLTVVAGLLGALATDAAAAARPVATIGDAVQNATTHRLDVSGHAYDPAHPARSIRLRIWVDGHFRTSVLANSASNYFDRVHHITGKHSYKVSLTYRSAVTTVAVIPTGLYRATATHGVRHVKTTTSPAARIIAIAKMYVGKARYREGGASPAAGFDCSGYTKYVYAQAHVKTLTHNAEAQRHQLRRISAAAARPGDLVFYLSGGSAYHVAIYAGNHKQYAAATPRDGIRFQPVWSSDVTYGTATH
jgi:cell wall-associated NlpC family hydrolase